MPGNRSDFPVHTLDCLTFLAASGLLTFSLTLAWITRGMRPAGSGVLTWYWDVFEICVNIVGVWPIQIVCAWCVVLAPVVFLRGIRNICARRN